MTPNFAAAVDPFIVYVVNLLDRIGEDEEPDPEEEHTRIRSLLDRAENQLGNDREGWDLAKYALTVWTDELLISAPWDGRGWWVSNAMEFAIFRTNVAFTEFFAKAREAANLTKKNALEVFYVCAVLGFRGLYRDPNAESLALDAELPPTFEGWAKKCATVIQLGQGVPPIHENPRPGTGAPPLEGQFIALGSLLLGITLAAICGLLAAAVWDWF